MYCVKSEEAESTQESKEGRLYSEMWSGIRMPLKEKMFHLHLCSCVLFFKTSVYPV